MRRCERCDAAVPEGARWCSLCHATFSTAYVPAPAPAPVFSRWEGDDVSLGGRARLVWTAGVLVLPLLVLGYVGVIGLFFVVAWVPAAWVVLRDVWRPTRVRP